MAAGSRRLPLIRQAGAAECGLACMAMVANYHGYRVNLAGLRTAHSISLKGCTLKSLVDVAASVRLDARPLRVELESLRALKTPCILHWDMNHFVVLEAVRRGQCVVHDPALGKRRYTMQAMSLHFTGIVLELTPSGDFQRRRAGPRMRLTDLWQRTTGLMPSFLHVLLLSLVIQLFVIASPLYLQLVVDVALTKQDADLLTVLALGFGLLMLINIGATALRGWIILYIGSSLGYQAASNLFRHLMRLPLDWFERRHVGDILSRFGSAGPVRDLFARGLVAGIIDGLMAAITMIVMFTYSPLLAAVVVTALGSYLLLRLALYRPLRSGSEDLVVAQAAGDSTLLESVRAIQSIRLLGGEAERRAAWRNRQADVVNRSFRLGRLKLGFDAANGLIFGIENVAVVYSGAVLVIDEQLTIGMLFAFMAYKAQFVDKATKLVERLVEYRLLDLHLDRLADIVLAEPESKPRTRAARADPGKRVPPATLRMHDLAFRYGMADPWVLRAASLTIRRGEMIALVGASGSGKSTLLKLLLGLLRPERGEILLDGIPLGVYGNAAFRRQVGTVMQEDALLKGSIADNIAFFDSGADYRKIRQTAERARIHDDIAAMPMGYDTLVGDMGAALSAGQRQRVLLARALYRDPAVLVLDEGTANLDARKEREIIDLLRELDATRICVAHRKALIAASDRVVLLRHGRLVELPNRGA
jgi:ATP-binding cassette subfamily B protein RaxB